MLSGAFIAMSACTNFEVERAVDLIFFCSVNSGKMLCTTPGTLISSSVHGWITYKIYRSQREILKSDRGSGELLLLCGPLTISTCIKLLALLL